jgi:hypothetical protein
MQIRVVIHCVSPLECLGKEVRLVTLLFLKPCKVLLDSRKLIPLVVQVLTLCL